MSSKSKPTLLEAAIVERLRRETEFEFHPTLVHSPLIYNEHSRAYTAKLFREYIDIALENELDIALATPTWRCNRERVEASDVPNEINRDCVSFLKEIKNSYEASVSTISIGGMVGCKNDCYLPDEALSADESADFCRWQVTELTESGVDFLIAETLPAVSEAKGIAQVMSETDLPYYISFVIDRNGNVLDGTPLNDAINEIDKSVTRKPVGYAVNCAYPTFLNGATQPAELFERFVGFMGNGSSLDHSELESADEVIQESVENWGEAMLDLYRDHGVTMLGGCCGTGGNYLRYLAENFRSPASK